MTLCSVEDYARSRDKLKIKGEPVESEPEKEHQDTPKLGRPAKRKSEVTKDEKSKKGKTEIKSPSRSRTQSPRQSSSRTSPASSSKSKESENEVELGTRLVMIFHDYFLF